MYICVLESKYKQCFGVVFLFSSDFIFTCIFPNLFAIISLGFWTFQSQHFYSHPEELLVSVAWQWKRSRSICSCLIVHIFPSFKFSNVLAIIYIICLESNKLLSLFSHNIFTFSSYPSGISTSHIGMSKKLFCIEKCLNWCGKILLS